MCSCADGVDGRQGIRLPRLRQRLMSRDAVDEREDGEEMRGLLLPFAAAAVRRTQGKVIYLKMAAMTR